MTAQACEHPARAVSLADQVSDILVLAVLARLISGRGGRPPAYRIFVASVFAPRPPAATASATTPPEQW
ncbi:hypothetical protein AB0M54_09550 [Actinoplanes sp. NPDC051470]|uniref:hypothetical protein n=1 Tax=unclassified Actinoplanes TaxID=2626549 RepID=UPI003424C8AC